MRYTKPKDRELSCVLDLQEVHLWLGKYKLLLELVSRSDISLFTQGEVADVAVFISLGIGRLVLP